MRVEYSKAKKLHMKVLQQLGVGKIYLQDTPVVRIRTWMRMEALSAPECLSS